MRHIRMVVGYDGTDFAGSQVQPGQRTVQGELEKALRKLEGESTRIVFAGRTDRGVHALGQVASATIKWAGSLGSFAYALNSVTPDDISIRDVTVVSNAFHARFDACWREYRYRIVESQDPPVLARRFAWWWRQPIDPVRADKAARIFQHRRPFGTFAGLGKSQQLDAVALTRTVYHCEWRTMQETSSLMPSGARQYELRISASGFLPRMVRNIVAAVLEVGCGNHDCNWVESMLAANDRRVLKVAPAPPQGLVLWNVGYHDYESGVARKTVDASNQLGVSGNE